MRLGLWRLMNSIFLRIKNVLRMKADQTHSIVWRKRHGGWLPDALILPIPEAPKKAFIEKLALKTDQEGPQPLHESYGQPNGTRRPDEVRSASYAGDLYAWLASTRRPEVLIEFGAAFGVSGMYWLAGLESAGKGRLYSFEINPAWASLARRNMAAISDRFTLTIGSFEERVDEVVAGKLIDIAFIDGIHTLEFITSQFEIILGRASKGALVLFDDIDFPTGRMREGWDRIWQRADVVAACEVNDHTGIVELARVP